MTVNLEEEEYKFCHQLLIENISILEKTEIYATGAIAASMVFSVASTDPAVAVAASYIPIMIAVVGVIRWMGLDGVIGRLNDYLQACAKGKTVDHGWTAFYRAKKPIALKVSRIAIWAILLGVSVFFNGFMSSHGAATPVKPAISDAASTERLEVIEAQQRLLISLFAVQQQKGICPTGLEVAVPGGPRSQPLYRCKGKLPGSK